MTVPKKESENRKSYDLHYKKKVLRSWKEAAQREHDVSELGGE